MTHTPAPWRVEGLGIYSGSPDHKGNYTKDTQVFPFYNEDGASDTGKRHEADKRLIEAAPELLEALRECITDDGAACMNTGQKTRRLQAINKIALEAIGKVIGQ